MGSANHIDRGSSATMSYVLMGGTVQELVYIGKIIAMEPIEGADFIASATVVCGHGGKWRGVVRKADFSIGDKCKVYLPDALIVPNDDMRFLESSGWRVRMRRFKGAPSEVVIMPIRELDCFLALDVGVDITDITRVTKYFKPVPANLSCMAKGDFPQFIPKTDEPNYQRHEDLVDALHGKPYYITEKEDGSSTTAYKYKGEFGICSRNLELKRDENNGYWQVAAKYALEDKLPEGHALQWETCGPKIQSNPMGLKSVDGFAFSAYKIEGHRYLDMCEFFSLCEDIKFPTAPLIDCGASFDKETVHTLGEGVYANGKQREGVVVRSQVNIDHAPISFKVINLNYEK